MAAIKRRSTVSDAFLARRAKEVAIAEEGGGDESVLENMSNACSACTKTNDDDALAHVDEELGSTTTMSTTKKL